MLLIVLLRNGETIKTPSVTKAAVEGDRLIARGRSGEVIAQFQMPDVRSHHLEED